MTNEEAPKAGWVYGMPRRAPQNDKGRHPSSERPSTVIANPCCHPDPPAVIPTPPAVIPTPPAVIPNGVRNLRSSSDGLSITTMGHRVSSSLDSSSCAPQNDREGGSSERQGGVLLRMTNEGAPKAGRVYGMPRRAAQNDKGRRPSSERPSTAIANPCCHPDPPLSLRTPAVIPTPHCHCEPLLSSRPPLLSFRTE